MSLPLFHPKTLEQGTNEPSNVSIDPSFIKYLLNSGSACLEIGIQVLKCSIADH